MFARGNKLSLRSLALIQANKGGVSFCKFRYKWHRTFETSSQCCGKRDDTNFSSLFIPVPIKPNPDDINVGAELTGSLNKSDLLKVLNKFYQKKETKMLALENGLDNYLLHQTYVSFRRYCLEADALPVDLHVVISDILQGAGHTDDIFPYFLRHARQMFPHLECMDDLKKISDIRSPANWYPGARTIARKIVFHAGPTNSGKTFHALERFLNSKSGVIWPVKVFVNLLLVGTNPFVFIPLKNLKKIIVILDSSAALHTNATSEDVL